MNDLLWQERVLYRKSTGEILLVLQKEYESSWTARDYKALPGHYVSLDYAKAAAEKKFSSKKKWYSF